MKRFIIILVSCVVIAGCTTTKNLQVKTNVRDASVEVTHSDPKSDINVVKESTASGANLAMPPSQDPYYVTVSAPGYEPIQREIRTADIEAAGSELDLTLKKIQETRTFVFRSDPSGAVVTVNGMEMGETPLESDLTFSRAKSALPWSKKEVTYTMDGFEPVSFVLNHDDPMDLDIVSLKRLRHDKPLMLAAETEDGDPIPVDVYMGGEFIGKTPLTIPLEFSRRSSDAPWLVFEFRLGLEDQYKFREFKQEYESPQERVLTLERVTEYMVPRAFPVIERSPLGAEIAMDTTSRVGTTIEYKGEPDDLGLRNLRVLTDTETEIQRADSESACIHSFTVTPDGENLIYAKSEKNTEGDWYSNLWLGSTEAYRGESPLTERPYQDSKPVIGMVDGSEAVVFQSNRAEWGSIDISKIRFSDNRVKGGITHLTSGRRFNFAPAYINENWDVFFLSLDHRIPKAEPQISHMGIDGRLPTFLRETAEDLALSPDGNRIYFSSPDSMSGKLQISFMDKEGARPTVMRTFPDANCFSPAISPDGQYMLFVTDKDVDPNGRNNNNVYLVSTNQNDAESRIPRPITQNISDDLAPAWSPIEPEVIFFISNRGGAYNIWRLEIDLSGVK